jgi:hypothetical protein
MFYNKYNMGFLNLLERNKQPKDKISRNRNCPIREEIHLFRQEIIMDIKTINRRAKR